MGEFDKILFNKLRLVKGKQLHTQLVKLIFFFLHDGRKERLITCFLQLTIAIHDFR